MTPPTETPDARAKALDAALAKIRKDHGEAAVIDMNEVKPQEAIPVALPLDVALGIGGIPKGRIIEVFGPESSGKTTLCYHAMASVQQAGGTAAFIDTEHAMDAAYARNLGVNVDDLIVSQPDYGEQALNIAQVLVESGVVDLIVVDSVAALTPKAEIEGQIGDQSVGLLARMMSQACRILAGKCSQTGTTLMFTNQIREKVGVMFGSPETQPGGRALKFYSSQRLDIRRIETIKDGDEAVGNKVRVKVVKNKVAPPFRQAEFVIAYGVGVDREKTLIEMFLNDKKLKETNKVTKSGSFYRFADATEPDKTHQGAAKAAVFLKETEPEVADKLDATARELLLAVPSADDATPGDEAAEAEADAAPAPAAA